MGKVTITEMKTAYYSAISWFRSEAPLDANMSDIRYMWVITVLAQFIYNIFYKHGRRIDQETFDITPTLLKKLPIIGFLCKDIVYCRNKLCHEMGSQAQKNLFGRLLDRKEDILNLCKFFKLSPTDLSNEDRLTLLCKLSGTKLSATYIASLIPEASWKDVEHLLSSFQQAIEQ